jgi:hypothetical protein
VLQADLSVSHDLHVSFGSGEAQLGKLLLEGGVHVHSIALLTLCLQPMQHQAMSQVTRTMHFMVTGQHLHCHALAITHDSDALHVWSEGSFGLLTLWPHPRQHQSASRMKHCHALFAFGATANSHLIMRMMRFMSGWEEELPSHALSTSKATAN